MLWEGNQARNSCLRSHNQDNLKSALQTFEMKLALMITFSGKVENIISTIYAQRNYFIWLYILAILISLLL